MAIITKITQQKRDNERYNIFLDGSYSFSVHESVLVKHGLTKGMTIDDLTVDEITYEDQIEKAFNRALHFLSFRMRSEHEVKQKLLQLEYGEAAVMEAITKLRRLGFLDDKSFSEALLRTQKNAGRKGPKAIENEFRKKGISKELSEQAMQQYSFDEQVEIASKLAEKAADSNKKATPAQVKQKITAALSRKGFSFEIINTVLETIDLTREEDEWEAISREIGNKAWRRYASKHTGYNLRNRVKQAMYQKGVPLEKIDQFIEEKESGE